MTTRADLTARTETHGRKPLTRSLGIVTAAALVTAALAAVALPRAGGPDEDRTETLVARCDRMAVTAANQRAAADTLPVQSAAIRRERERAFTVCIDDAATRGMARRP
jgi:hypothetical protein